MSQQRVFVYGTLKPGGFYWDRYCEGKVIAHQPARTHGKLYHLDPGYPGLEPSDSCARGVILTLRDDAALAGFDELEGYQPDRPQEDNDYQRRWVECWDDEGHSLGHAWAYYMLPDKIRAYNGIPVPGENWERSDFVPS